MNDMDMKSLKSAVLAKCEELAPFVDSPIGVSSCRYDPSLQKCNIRHPRWRMVLSESVIILSDKLPDNHPLWNLAAKILGIEDEQAAKDRNYVQSAVQNATVSRNEDKVIIRGVNAWYRIRKMIGLEVKND